MSGTLLGRLEKLELEVAWENPADFLPWLAREENLRQLSETVRLPLEDLTREERCGTWGDALCREKRADDGAIALEAQLEPSTDLRLGQLVSHAARRGRLTVIWVAAGFSEEHLRALDWLNRAAHDGCRFYAVALELWRINYSPAAPTFTLVCRPAEVGPPLNLTEEERLQLDYWTTFARVLSERGGPLELTAPKGKTWAAFPVERDGFDLWAFLNRGERRVGLVLETFGGHAKAHFHLLREEQEAIEREVGEALEWDERPGQKGAAVMLRRLEADPAARGDWPDQHAWLVDRLQRFHQALLPRIEKLDAADYFRVDDEPDLTSLDIPVDLLNLDALA